MSRSLRALLGVALPILAIVIFVVLLAFSLMRLSDIERDMRIEATQNMLWVISRAHIASLQLGKTAVADNPAGADLKLRYDVFLSRLSLLDDGPQFRQMQQLGFAGALDEFRDSLAELRTIISAPSGQADMQRVKKLLEPYEVMLGQAANKAMVAEWDSLGDRLDISRKQIWHIIISLIGISLAGAVLCAHFIMSIRDIRRRTRLLNKEKAFSELLIGSSGEGIVAIDMQRRCTVWNEAAERLFAMPSAKTTGRVLGDVSGFFQVEKVAQAIGSALDGKSAALFDQPFFRSERAEALYVDLRCFSLRDNEQIIGSILLVSDVTERRAVQKKIADHRDLLEEMVRERTCELDAALTRERATSDLYRNLGTMISHQFRTPLAIIDSALQRLMRRADRLSRSEILERCENSRHAVARLTRLVDSTLDAARLDDGQIEIRSQSCDLSSLIAEICARQKEQTPERVIAIREADATPVFAHCDPVHAENILTNLLSNAVKYSPASTPIEISLITEDDRVGCVVSNHGRIDCPAEKDALFERYFRGSNAGGQPGIGIGLYMARTLARMQGGDVQFASDHDNRIAFTLFLPRIGASRKDFKATALLVEPA